MTEGTAKTIFDQLLSEVRLNGFTDIGTFMIDEVEKEFEYEKFDDKYEYMDTKTILASYEALSAKPQGASTALKKLVNASIEYFSLAYQIPDKYAKEIDSLNKISDEYIEDTCDLIDESSVVHKINLEDINEKAINIDCLLKNKSIIDLVSLLKKIKEGFEQDDETFLNSIQLLCH